MENNEKIGFWNRPGVLLTFAIVFTAAWLAAFPLLFMIAIWGNQIITGSHFNLPPTLDYYISLFSFCIPMASPAAIVCIWLSHAFKKTKWLFYSNLIPPATALAILLFVFALSHLSRLIQ